jgi:hypothetical protein
VIESPTEIRPDRLASRPLPFRLHPRTQVAHPTIQSHPVIPPPRDCCGTGRSKPWAPAPRLHVLHVWHERTCSTTPRAWPRVHGGWQARGGPGRRVGGVAAWRVVRLLRGRGWEGGLRARVGGAARPGGTQRSCGGARATRVVVVVVMAAAAAVVSERQRTPQRPPAATAPQRTAPPAAGRAARVAAEGPRGAAVRGGSGAWGAGEVGARREWGEPGGRAATPRDAPVARRTRRALHVEPGGEGGREERESEQAGERASSMQQGGAQWPGRRIALRSRCGPAGQTQPDSARGPRQVRNIILAAVLRFRATHRIMPMDGAQARPGEPVREGVCLT